MRIILALSLVPLIYAYVVRRWLYDTAYWEKREKELARFGLKDLSGGSPGGVG